MTKKKKNTTNFLKKKDRLFNFLKRDVWRIPLKDLPPRQSFLVKQLRIFLLAFKGFDEDKCQLRASALTFYSLLSIVPVVAMVFGIAKGFGFQQRLEEQMLQKFAGHEEVMEKIIAFSQSMLETTKGGLIAGVGVVMLFWAVMKVLGNIEGSFNDIWQIKRGRSFVRKFSDYFSIMLIAPIILLLSSSLTVFIKTQVEQITAQIELLGYITPLIFFFLKLIPYCLIWIVFTILYMVMPNTRVTFKSALIAGIIGGTLFQLTEWAYITFQVGAVRYNAIYGSFAALPLFLIWMQTSWLIVLFGAEISFANQNVDKYEFEAESEEISHSFKQLIALLATQKVVRQFSAGEQPLTGKELSQFLESPVRIVNQVLFELTEAGILAEVKTKHEKETAYQPGISVDKLSIGYVIEALEKQGEDKTDIPVTESKAMQVLSEKMKKLRQEMKNSPENVLLNAID